MRSSGVVAAVSAGLLAVLSVSVAAQEAPTPAEPASELPPVEVIQKKATPAPSAQKKAAPKKKQATVSPAPQAAPPPEVLPTPSTDPNPIYGSPASAGAAERATQSAQTPVNPTALVPSSLEGFSSAATIVDKETLTERRPSDINDALTRVPGVVVINDDGSAHHGGIGIRGAPPRRSRKMLVMEDGHAANLALWLDPSVHYWAPLERLESLEVLRGTVITHGPNNNFGVINARNLSPFGPDETVITTAIGFTETNKGTYNPVDEIVIDDNTGAVNIVPDTPVPGKSETDISARWHVHTRQSAGNVGLVASYTGEDVQGAWDTERLRFHDFYGALGWKGSTSDLTVSVIHARQNDDYDEQNYLGFYGVEFVNGPGDDDDAAEAAAGLAEKQFHELGHCKTCFAPASGLNNYTGEIWRGQAVHNAYLDDDTTITSRFYAGYHRRDRYQLISFGANPNGQPTGTFDQNFAWEQEEDENGNLLDTYQLLFGEESMFGRLRTFRHVGGEVRGEWANQNLLGFRNDVQAGIRYEYQDMTNRNFIGFEHAILGNGDSEGATIFDRSLRANTVSAFLQTNMYVAKDFNVLPGIRFEWYDVNRRNRVIAEEEGEAGEEDDDCPGGLNECLGIGGIDRDPANPTDGTSSFNALPGVAFAYTGLYRSTVFGGYHRGLTTNVLRNEDFPSPDEIGDNFNVGLRSSAITGFDFEVVGFHHRFTDFQYGESFSSVTGDREFGRAEEAQVSGVELYGRLNSRPFTGGPFNFYAESNYTYARGILKKAFTYEDDGVTIDDDYSGKRIPETPWHVAALTLGVEQRTGWRWNASVTWTYRGSFFTDAANTPYGFGLEAEEEDDPGEFEVEEAGEGGGVPSIWLLSARFNLDIGDTGASVFVSGHNLLDELYITDREDGMKPGLGRTVWAGFRYKF
jgi:Fe(3+) dicitrate transport protein